MPYVIRRIDQGGGWVCDPDKNPTGGSSFSTKLQHAMHYPTEESAKRDCCVENEVVERLEDAREP